MKINLKAVAYSSMTILLISLIFVILVTSVFKQDSLLAEAISNLYFLIITILTLVVFNGYLLLSRKYEAKLLNVMTWVGMVLNVLFLIMLIIGILSSVMPTASAQEITDFSNIQSSKGQLTQDIASPQITEEQALQTLISMFILYAFFSLIFGAYLVLFGFGLFKLKNKIPYSRSTAISYILAGFTLIILIGFFILIVAKILEVIMFFKASKILDKKEKPTKKRTKKSKTKKKKSILTTKN